MSSLQGFCLIAPPGLCDDNFFRTVVLVIEHDDQGAVGVILNRPTSDPVDDVMRLLDDDGVDLERTTSELIYYGGPVPGPLVVIHTLAEYSEREILPGVYFASQKNNLQHVIGMADGPYRVYSGYAGWSAGQLEGELQRGGWFIVPHDPAASQPDLFAETEHMWREMKSSVGMEILGDSISSNSFPQDPSVN